MPDADGNGHARWGQLKIWIISFALLALAGGLVQFASWWSGRDADERLGRIARNAEGGREKIEQDAEAGREKIELDAQLERARLESALRRDIDRIEASLRGIQETLAGKVGYTTRLEDLAAMNRTLARIEARLDRLEERLFPSRASQQPQRPYPR